MWWFIRIKNVFITKERLKYAEFLFFKNIGGVLATIPSIFMYCCKLCNQIKSDMKPLKLTGMGTPPLKPNTLCLNHFEDGLKNNFVNFFQQTNISPGVDQPQNEASWKNCGLARKTSCAALWVIQFIMTYSFPPPPPPNEDDPFAPLRNFRIGDFIKIINQEAERRNVNLSFNKDDIPSVKNYYDQALGYAAGSQQRARFFGRHVGPTIDIQRQQGGAPILLFEGMPYTTLADKYLGIQAILLKKLRDATADRR